MGCPDQRRLVEREQLVVQPCDGQRCDADLLAMGGAGMRVAGEHVDPVRDLVLAHRAVMRHAGEADAEAAEREHAMQVAVGGNVMRLEAGGRLDHLGLVVRRSVS